MMDPHDHSVDPRNSAYAMPGATLFPEALASILKTVRKALGTVFFVPGNLVAPRMTCTVPESSRWFSAMSPSLNSDATHILRERRQLNAKSRIKHTACEGSHVHVSQMNDQH